MTTVTARGASTSTASTFSGGLTTNILSFSAPSGDPSPVITARVVPSGQGAAAELTELILFHSNDPNNGAGPDYITLRSPAIRFQTYNNAAVSDIANNLGSNDRIRIEPDGTIKLSSLTSNGFVKTSASDGTLSVDTNTYLTGNQTITLSGVVTGSGTTSITTAIANGVISNAMLANSSFFIGTTSISLGRATASQTLTGVSIDGNAATSTEVIRTVSAGNEANLLYATIADNDYFRIRVGGGSNSGFVEIATADDATEPIHVRQYSGTFSTLTRTATILDGSGNTSFPGTVTAPTFSGALSGNATTATTASNSSALGGISASGFWQAGGSWGADLTSNGYTRQIGLAYTGGEFSILTNNAQISALLDGSYFAGEQGGFYSLNASNQFASRVGFNRDGSGNASFNASIVPTTNGTLNLGSSGARWNTIFTSDLSMSNGIGDYTIVEGEEDLFIYNNKTNKVFKFLLQEVDPSIAPAKKVH